ncbi:MAG: hypothetical protein IJS89_05400 [Bacteroidaceae bacterium]|nr:hypothetical protein [Bacteroidaceae bacterium]
MTTASLHNLWQYIDSLNLSRRSNAWLAEKLIEKNRAKEAVAKEKDSALMTKEEFFARVDEARKGPTYRLEQGETIDDLIKRVVG